MIRKAYPEDTDLLLQLEQGAMDHPWTREDIKALTEDCKKIALMSEDEKGATGYIGASFVLDEAEIGNLCVREDMRRQGIAQKILEELKIRLKDKGIKTIFLEVSDSNVPAKALYIKEGFSEYSRRKDYYGPGDDAVLMRCDMEDSKKTEQDRLLEIASRLHAFSSAGLTYTKDRFDRDRFQEIRDIAAELMTFKVDGITREEAVDLFAKNDGYPTPKTETRAIIFNDKDQVLLVKDYDGKWTVPGGWCERDLTVKQNVVKEAYEEAGLDVEPVRLVAVHSHKMRNNPKSFFSCFKYLILCDVKGGSFRENDETTECAYFDLDSIPEAFNSHKVNLDQIRLCLKAKHSDMWVPEYD